jgi:hypothetical protein
MSFTVLNSGWVSLSQQLQKFHKHLGGCIPVIIVKKDVLNIWKATEAAVRTFRSYLSEKSIDENFYII